MELINDSVTTRYSLFYDAPGCDDVLLLRSINRSRSLAVKDLLDDAPAVRFLSSDAWTTTRVVVAACLAVASLIANRVLLLDVTRRQLNDKHPAVTGALTPAANPRLGLF